MAEERRIERLDETVVNRIAAGEILHRPANAVKEMIENSIDAKSTSIHVIVKDGGMKLLQIQDNGHGILKADMSIVCERFTTSKLRKFEDLNSIGTYGFRGEALASVSHVAHVTITTKTAASNCAWKASYKDGKMIGEPKPCAGTTGTIISVEDLFYNVATRRKALNNHSDEFSRIIDVISRYAVHNTGIAFVCKKHGSTAAEVTTMATATRLDTIRSLYGAPLARELLPLEYKSDKLKFKASGMISNANYNVKKFAFLLFINHRSVDCGNLKKAIEAVYATYLPKGTHPFVYLSLEIEPSHVDVNVHPTKQEVHFLNEDQIIEEVSTSFQQKLLSANSSRTFFTQTLLPGVPANKPPTKPRDETTGDFDEDDDITSKNKNEKERAHLLVRTDNRTRSMDAFVSKKPKDTNEARSNRPTEEPEPSRKRSKRVEEEAEADHAAGERVPVRLASILQLREAITQEQHQGLLSLFRDHFFVGIVNDYLALIQHQTKLFILNFRDISADLFYQLIMREFMNFGRITLTSSASVTQLVLMALEMAEAGWTEQDGPKDEIAKTISDILVSRAAMLAEYFSINVTPDGKIETLPIVLKGYLPNLDNLPMFLLRLGAEVEWTSEKECLEGISRQIAWLYRLTPPFALPEDAATQVQQQQKDYRWQIEHVLFPALRYYFVPPKRLADNGDIIQIADLPDLYKIFERC